MKKELIKLANHLDRIGLTKEADFIDNLFETNEKKNKIHFDRKYQNLVNELTSYDKSQGSKKAIELIEKAMNFQQEYSDYEGLNNDKKYFLNSSIKEIRNTHKKQNTENPDYLDNIEGIQSMFLKEYNIMVNKLTSYEGAEPPLDVIFEVMDFIDRYAGNPEMTETRRSFLENAIGQSEGSMKKKRYPKRDRMLRNEKEYRERGYKIVIHGPPLRELGGDKAVYAVKEESGRGGFVTLEIINLMDRTRCDTVVRDEYDIMRTIEDCKKNQFKGNIRWKKN